MDSFKSEILGAMNIKSYSLRRPSLIKNTDKGLLYADVLRSFPYFVFVGDDNYNREWVFNLVGYLRYLSYPCGWYGRESVRLQCLSFRTERNRIFQSIPVKAEKEICGA